MAEKKYIPIIDYLKAFAIMLVTTTHFFTYNDKDFVCDSDGDAVVHALDWVQYGNEQ